MHTHGTAVLDRPAEVTLLEGGKESRLTDAGASLANYAAVHPKRVSWKSRDGLPIEGATISFLLSGGGSARMFGGWLQHKGPGKAAYT